MSIEIGKHKVLVRSAFREGVAKTWVDYEEDPKTGAVTELSYFRRFHEHHAYMTPQEARFLVESEENQAHIDGGLPPPYSYPNGQAFPQPLDFGGETLGPPIPEGALSTQDERQAAASKRKSDRRESILAKKRAANAGAGAE